MIVGKQPTEVSAVDRLVIVHKAEQGQAHLVSLEGEVDLATAAQFRTHLDRRIVAGVRWLVVNLKPLSFMSLAGLAVLVHVHRTAADRGVAVKLVAGPRLRRLFAITNLDETFDVHQTIMSALTEVSQNSTGVRSSSSGRRSFGASQLSKRRKPPGSPGRGQ